jgi:hypothetical protein
MQPQAAPYTPPQYTPPQVVVTQQQQQPFVSGAPMMGGAYPATSATTALILSILSLFCGGICFAIPGLIMANSALTITDSYPGHPDSGSAKAAQVISWIVIGLTIAMVGFYVLFFILLMIS